MKKITLLAILMLSTTFVDAQNNYLEVSSDQVEVNSSNAEAIITRPDNRQPIVDTYTSLTDFNNAVTENCADTSLTLEDFRGGPSLITNCGPVVSSGGDSCFSAGEIEEGFIVTASNNSDVVTIPANAIGNANELVGASAFAEFTIISFDPPVFAVAMDIWENIDPTTSVRVFGSGGELIDSFDANTPVNTQTFFGVIADEEITAIELEGNNASGELFGNFFYGGNCSLSIENNILSQIDIYPNPASEFIKLRLPAGIEINSIILYDATGKALNVDYANDSISISDLNNGIYFLKVNTSEGSITKRIFKK
jgi:hypothetical protein